MNTNQSTVTSPIRPFVIARTFKAPRELVWKAWTDVAHLQQWLAPTGCTMPVAKMDFRPGGTFHYCQRTPDGHEMWGKWTFREIVQPERIQLIQAFSDKDGGITHHPMAPNWPAETISTTTFEERDGSTIVTIRWAPHNATEEQRALFDASHDSMRQGWGGTFEQLDQYLAKATATKGTK